MQAHVGARGVFVQAAQRLGATSVRLQAQPDNSGVVYVGLSGMEGSPSGPNLLGVIGKPASSTAASFDFFEVRFADIPAGLNLWDIFVDGTTGDGVIVSYTAI